jgi:hypothetical protein
MKQITNVLDVTQMIGCNCQTGATPMIWEIKSFPKEFNAANVERLKKLAAMLLTELSMFLISMLETRFCKGFEHF